MVVVAWLFSSDADNCTPPVQPQVIERDRDSGSLTEVAKVLLQEAVPAV